MMNVHAAQQQGSKVRICGDADRVCRTPNLHYLWPSRYFHFYVLYDRKRHQTCWLPEGYGQ